MLLMLFDKGSLPLLLHSQVCVLPFPLPSFSFVLWSESGTLAAAMGCPGLTGALQRWKGVLEADALPTAAAAERPGPSLAGRTLSVAAWRVPTVAPVRAVAGQCSVAPGARLVALPLWFRAGCHVHWSGDRQRHAGVWSPLWH